MIIGRVRHCSQSHLCPCNRSSPQHRKRFPERRNVLRLALGCLSAVETSDNGSMQSSSYSRTNTCVHMYKHTYTHKQQARVDQTLHAQTECKHTNISPPLHPVVFFAWPVFPNEQLLLCWAGNCKISKALDEKWLPTLSASRSRKLCTLLFVVSLLHAHGENYSSLFFFAIHRSCFLLYVECVGSEEVWRGGGRLMLSSLWLVSVFLLRWTRTEGEEGRKGEGGIREAVQGVGTKRRNSQAILSQNYSSAGYI